MWQCCEIWHTPAGICGSDSDTLLYLAQFYPSVHTLLPRILELLLGFVRRTHISLAAVGVSALVQLMVSAGAQMDEATWQQVSLLAPP